MLDSENWGTCAEQEQRTTRSTSTTRTSTIHENETLIAFKL